MGKEGTEVDDLQSLEALQDDVTKGACCSGGGLCGKWRLTMAVLVRCMLLVHASVAVWLVVSLTSRQQLWALLASLLLMGLEALYTLVKRGGRESRWICPCFLAYLAAALPPIWLVELDRLERFNDALDNSNSNLTSLVQVNGLTVPIKLKPEVWVSLMEQALLFLLVLARWLLPRGDISRQELSQLLFVFMGIASDNMELFELFDETEVRQDRVLTYVILSVWSLSLLQFVMVLTAKGNPRKIAVFSQETNPEGKDNRKKKPKRSMYEIVFATEIWSLVFSIMVQDGPYAAIRIYTLVKYDLLTYSIIFFICKNLLVISLVSYRLIIICIYKCGSDDKKEEEEEEVVKEERRRRDRRLLYSTGSSKVGSVPESQPVPLHKLSQQDMTVSDI